jgi:hypothetical protein
MLQLFMRERCADGLGDRYTNNASPEPNTGGKATGADTVLVLIPVLQTQFRVSLTDAARPPALAQCLQYLQFLQALHGSFP